MVIEHTHTLLYVTKVATQIVNFTLTQALNAQRLSCSLPHTWKAQYFCFSMLVRSFESSGLVCGVGEIPTGSVMWCGGDLNRPYDNSWTSDIFQTNSQYASMS